MSKDKSNNKGNSGVGFDAVDLTVIGDNGEPNTSKPVNDEVRALIKRGYMEVTGGDVTDKATASITINIKISRLGEHNARIVHDVKYVSPKKVRNGMVAHFDPETGEVVTQDHKQLSFDGEKVIPIHNPNAPHAKEGKQS